MKKITIAITFALLVVIGILLYYMFIGNEWMSTELKMYDITLILLDVAVIAHNARIAKEKKVGV